MRPTPSHAALLLATAVLLAACGGGSEPGTGGAKAGPADAKTTAAPAPPAIDACVLFSYEEASAIAGGYVSGMSSTLEDAQGRDPLTCAYNAGSTEQPQILSLVVRLHPSPERAESTLAAARKALTTMTRGDLSDVPELGDGAFWAGGGLRQLHVRKGEKQLLVTCQLLDPEAARNGAKKIAEQALARL